MIDMRVGTRIDYSLRVHGLPLRWTSEITAWDPPRSFVDVQVRGPYRWWHHLHQFDEVEGSTKATDEVEYACPGGRIVNALFVERDLRRIFQYRLEFLKTRFSGNLGKSIDSGLGRS
jgi:ligand-binding SRPBCC domain-containing protein